ncbi:MAG: hypothetical protein L0Y74_00175, partial [candidate division Zixibacteria bacterium]|nr:hypothetical protein [candidate division Zixibacteria bacterium]
MQGYKILLAASAVFLMQFAARADVPQLISYQGNLTDSVGIPLANNNYSVLFTVYNSGTFGVSKWSETQNVSTDAQGRFSVMLGSVNPIDDTVFNQPDRWLGIKVGADPEMIPRTRIAAVGYSNRVSTVDGATGGTVTGDVTIASQLTVAGKIHSTADGVQFPDSSILTTGLIVPIGAVVAWLKTYANTPPLPPNFVECAGQLLIDPQSPFHGQTIPTLTGGRFLRGATSSGATGGVTTHSHTVPTELETIVDPTDAADVHVTTGL